MASNNECTLSSFERNRFFYGKLLTARDFEVEQKYGIEKNRLINRLILGKGIVCGLKIEIDRQQQDRNFLNFAISPGVALDGCGCEIVVSRMKSEQLEVKSPGTKYLYIKYEERFKEPIADLANGSPGELNNGYNRVEETYSLSLSQEPPPEKDPEPELNGDSLDEIVQNYYSQLLKTCSKTNRYSQIPIAVVDISETGEATIDEEATREHRPIVRSNPMLYDLLKRVYNLASEEVTAARITADSFVSSDGSIKIDRTEDPKAFDFTLTSENSEPTTQTRVFTGKKVLKLSEDKNLPEGSLQPVSVKVIGVEDKEPFSVILAPQLPATVPPVFTPILGEQEGKSGLRFVFGSHPQLPRTYVAYVPQPYNKTFEIHGCDPNLSEDEDVEVFYWVIAGATLRDRILELLGNNPEGMRIGTIREELDVDLETEVLTQLMDQGLIKRSSNNKYSLV